MTPLQLVQGSPRVMICLTTLVPLDNDGRAFPRDCTILEAP